ncbi:MAG: ATP-binding protein, partial [Endomicrobia bacterium]|nr:ATP-binding protein [Endomicrobiia bacterium]
VISFQANNILRPSLRTLYLELHTKTIENVAVRIKSYFEVFSQILPFIEEIVARTDISWENKQNMLESLIDVNKNIVAISILNTNGQEKIKIYNPELIKNPVLENFSKETFFIEFKNSKLQNILCNFRFHEDIYKVDCFYKQRNFYIRVTLSLSSLFEQLTSYYVGKTGFITILSPQEKTLVFTNATNKTLAESLLNNPIIELAKQFTTVGSKEFVIDETGYIASYISLPVLDWVVILQQEQNEAYYASNLLSQRTTRVILILILLSTIISFLTATGISTPILKLINAAKTVASGNFNVNIKIKTYDELEILGDTFNHMAQKLNEYAEIQLDKLIAEKTKTEAIIFSIRDGIILTNYNGDILLINQKAKDILNISNETENMNIFNILSDNVKKVFEEAINQPNKIFELDLSTENFARYYQTISLPVSTPKKEIIGVVTVLHDITLEKELDKMKDDFLHSITHDLRNPMTSIRGFIKFLSDGVAGPVNEQQKKMLETMDRASFKLLNMINDILDIAKLEAGKMELIMEKVNLVKVIQSVLELQQPQYERKNIKVIFTPPQQEILIDADGKLLERVYINLIGNAIKFTPEGGTITVGIKVNNDNTIESYVQDTGEGIPKEYQEKIFEKFGQVKNKTKGGTGLGLTICKYIIEAHKGKIWVESEIGHGAKFIFTLPQTQS